MAEPDSPPLVCGVGDLCLMDRMKWMDATAGDVRHPLVPEASFSVLLVGYSLQRTAAAMQ